MKGNMGQRTSYWSENRITDKTLQVVFVSLRTEGAMVMQISAVLSSDGQLCGVHNAVPNETGSGLFRKLQYLKKNSS